jgi:hypothetical protein
MAGRKRKRMSFTSEIDADGHSRHAVDNSANQYDVSGSTWSLGSAR